MQGPQPRNRCLIGVAPFDRFHFHGKGSGGCARRGRASQGMAGYGVVQNGVLRSTQGLPAARGCARQILGHIGMRILSDKPTAAQAFRDKAHPKSAAHARSMGNGKRALGDLPQWGSGGRTSSLAYVDAHLWACTKPGLSCPGVQKSAHDYVHTQCGNRAREQTFFLSPRAWPIAPIAYHT